jgi:hypothetical protein
MRSVGGVRPVVRSTVISVFLLCLPVALADGARCEEVLPPVGGVASPADAMVFYLARGPAGSCGQNCSEWIAAEGKIYWDTHKRLLALLDRIAGRKPPILLGMSGEGSDLNVATAMGRIIRERRLDIGVGSTRVERCIGTTEAECLVLKRGSDPLESTIDVSAGQCDLACVLLLAGGVHRSIPAAAKVEITGMRIKNRLGLNVSEEHREGLSSFFGDQFRLYLARMGIDPELFDIIKRNSETPGRTLLSPDDRVRLKIVNATTL